jgi:hypothetical protein
MKKLPTDFKRILKIFFALPSPGSQAGHQPADEDECRTFYSGARI